MARPIRPAPVTAPARGHAPGARPSAGTQPRRFLRGADRPAGRNPAAGPGMLLQPEPQVQYNAEPLSAVPPAWPTAAQRGPLTRRNDEGPSASTRTAPQRTAFASPVHANRQASGAELRCNFHSNCTEIAVRIDGRCFPRIFQLAERLRTLTNVRGPSRTIWFNHYPESFPLAVFRVSISSYTCCVTWLHEPGACRHRVDSRQVGLGRNRTTPSWPDVFVQPLSGRYHKPGCAPATRPRFFH